MPFKTKHIPTEMTRQKVQLLVAFQINEDVIAHEIGVTGKTLRRWYKKEIEFGAQRAVASVASKLYTKATSSDRDALTAMIFFLKVRGGWHETVRLANDDGSPIVDLSAATDEQLEQLAKLQNDIARAAKFAQRQSGGSPGRAIKAPSEA